MSNASYLHSDNHENVEKLLSFLHEWYLSGGSTVHGSTLANDDETFADLVRKATFGRDTLGNLAEAHAVELERQGNDIAEQAEREQEERYSQDLGDAERRSNRRS